MLLVEEDEFTEKIDIDQEKTETNKNQECEDHQPKDITLESESDPCPQPVVPDAPLVVATESISKEQVEIITASDVNTQSETRPFSPKQAFTDCEARDTTEEDERPRARVAFADPTLSIDNNIQNPQNISTSPSSNHEPHQEEITLASLTPEDIPSEQSSSAVNQETKDSLVLGNIEYSDQDNETCF